MPTSSEGLHGVEVAPEASAVGGSQSNGLAEHATREEKTNIRTLKKTEELNTVKLWVDQLI